MAQEQTRWGQRNQQLGWFAPDIQVYPPAQGWQQQSKWRRKLQQQQSWVANTVVYVPTAQVTVTALAPQVVISGVGWQQQSKWRRKTQQLPISFAPLPAGALIVSLTTAQVNVAALAPTVPETVALGLAQVNVAAYAPTIQIITPPPLQGQLPQARWGQYRQPSPAIASRRYFRQSDDRSG